MVRSAAIVLLLVLFLASPLPSAAETGSDPPIRALRGPLSPTGLPPFAVTSISLLCIGAIVLYRRRKNVQTPVVSEQAGYPVSPCDLLALLLEETRRQQCLPAETVERLMPIVRSHLAEKGGTSAVHNTSQELIARLLRTGETEALLRASGLLRLCDTIRFGGVAPTFAQAEWALQETLLLLQEQSEKPS
ncbi:MAG: hypothetical protein ACOYL3_02125 [Desulfuromonadaceae bacterium]